MNETVTRLHAVSPVVVWELLTALGAAAIGIAVALVAHRLFYVVLRRLAAATESRADDIVLERLRRPTRWALVALGLVLAARETPLLAGIWEKLAGFVMPALIGWIAIAALRAFVEAACLDDPTTTADDLKVRRRQTRLAIISRIATFIIIFITVGLMLLSIPGVREIGVTLMASAGIAGLAVGAAAQPALKSLIAGMQMALTEPIAIGDLVKIDGQTGRVEDLRSTYVVLRTWDQRRVVVPTAKFLETTFENWTRAGNELLGPVILHLDPLAEIEPLRAEFERLVRANPLWDGREVSLKVVEMTAGSIEVRGVASAASPGDAFELRSALREAILAYIRAHQPGAIAYQRSDESAAEAPAAG